MDLAQKIRALRDDREWTQGDLAERSGVGKSSIQLYESGKGNITQLNLEKIANAFGVKTSYFLNEKMSNSVSIRDNENLSISVHKSQNLSNSISPNPSNLKKTEADQISHDQILIRKLSSAVGAGESVDINGVEVYDTDILVPFSQMLFKVRPKKIDRIRCMQVDGYSMVPMLFPDSWVIADVTAKFEGDGLYIINYCGNFMVKLLQKSPGGTLRIKSVNKDYDSYEIGPDDEAQAYIVGKVLRCVI